MSGFLDNAKTVINRTINEAELCHYLSTLETIEVNSVRGHCPQCAESVHNVRTVSDILDGAEVRLP